jgi:hypothetical protein
MAPMGKLSIRSLALGGVALLVGLTGCQSQLRENSMFQIQNYISGVTDGSGALLATLHNGAPPAVTGSNAASVSGIAVAINGGSSQQTVTATTAFTSVIVYLDGLDGYYELTLPAATTSQTVIVSVGQEVVAGQLYFNFGVGDPAVGSYARQRMRILAVGHGDIQISVAWTDSADVDLHVLDPNNEEIYFGHKTSASGGVLDLDANAACGKNTLPDGTQAYVSNENVTWPVGMAINGTYKVVLDLWSACGVTKTDWVVTLQRVGAQTQIFTGSFNGVPAGTDDSVTTFTY